MAVPLEFVKTSWSWALLPPGWRIEKQGDDMRGEVYAARLVGLGLADDRGALAPGLERTADVDAAVEEVDISPAEFVQLAGSQAGVGGDVDQRAVLGVDRFGEGGDLGGG